MRTKPHSMPTLLTRNPMMFSVKTTARLRAAIDRFCREGSVFCDPGGELTLRDEIDDIADVLRVTRRYAEVSSDGARSLEHVSGDSMVLNLFQSS